MRNLVFFFHLDMTKLKNDGKSKRMVVINHATIDLTENYFEGIGN